MAQVRVGRRFGLVTVTVCSLAITLASLGFGPTPVAAAEETLTFTGSLSSSGTNWQTHAFKVTEVSTISVSLDWNDAGADFNLGLQDPSGTWVKWASSTSTRPETISWPDAVTGTWKIGVKARSGSASYTASVTHGASGTDPVTTDTSTSTFTGSLSTSGTTWRTHAFAVGGSGTIDVVLDWDDAAANLNVGLQNPSGTWVKWASSTSTKPERISYPDGTAGTWKIGVQIKSGSAAYTATVTYPGSSTAAPAYVQTVGGSGRAEMYPSGVDVARPSRGAPGSQAGWVFIADTGNDRVAAYGADATLLWQSGFRGRGDGRFSEPRDVAYLNGEVYVADTGNNRVQVLDAATGAWKATWPTFFGAVMGVTTGKDTAGQWKVVVADGKNSRMSVHTPDDSARVYFGTFGKGDGQLNEPRDGAFDRAGNVYVADFRNHRVAKFTGAYTWAGSWGSLGGEPGQFRGPYGIEVDDADGVYVADANNQRIQKFTTAGAYVSSWGTIGSGTGELRQLRNVAVGAGTSPDVFAVDLWGYKVEQWGQGGVHKRTFAGDPPPTGLFNKPWGLSVGGGNVYVADTVHHRIQRFDLAGGYQMNWGDRGWAPNLNGLNWPRGVAYDPARDVVWVADTKNWRVTEFTTGGVPTGVTYGKLGSGDGGLNWPGAVAPVGAGVVIADTYNHRVVRWDPAAGTLWTATGFNYPKDVKVDAKTGTVYVADALNKRIVTLRLSDGALLGSFGGTVLHRVEGVAIASDGDIWATDTSYNRLVEFDASGTFKQAYGGKGSDHGRFWEPTNLHLRPNGTNGDLLYVADTYNDRVEVFEVR